MRRTKRCIWPKQEGKTGIAVTRAGGGVSIAAEALAKACLDTVLTYGEQAKKDVESHQCTDAVENVVEANTYLSGIGFESGGLAAAHALHNGLALLPEVRRFCRSVGLPVSLKDMGAEGIPEERLYEAAVKSCSPEETMHHIGRTVEPEEVAEVMRRLM